MADKLQLATEKLLELQADVAILQLRMALKKFDPNQPRWPPGQSDGGQWRPADENDVPQIGYDAARIPSCELQRQLDHELCRAAKSWKCWASADERYDNCVRNAYIPPLEVGK